MMFKQIINTKGFWKSVVFLGILFALVYDIIDLWFSFGFDVSTYVEVYFSSPSRIVRFLIANIIGGFIYGFIITFFKFRSRIRENQRK
ncbi:MAG TPA: hypothetical protein VFM65_07185 [Flavobacteriaceae bacterium]|nr:hypothetical protein [Flavobacteriaceae bacterium]